ncbi:hypothetical protein F8568_025645 [Actinomadura sp. LD22]|uniref:Uncharacterized protein n=1 Tax=Actinomadura physcomitrii TaxID=2650748 RepID=A0A6I4MI63_9ACTN|nr:hypothetical protein [Actinomadura physcomitrii]MWA03707.1 hypothetical protein [Actinomadura physcomitrii]
MVYTLTSVRGSAYPNVFGNGPLPNLVGGWAGLVVAPPPESPGRARHDV